MSKMFSFFGSGTKTRQPFLDISVNPSFEIVKLLPSSIDGVEIIAHPEPLKAAYHSLLQAPPQLLKEHDPDIVVHIGLAVDRDYFAVEQSATRDGYHQYPDVDRRVFSKLEGQKLWGKKSPETISTSFNLEQVVELWRQKLAIQAGGSAKKGKRQKSSESGELADVRLSDDVGTYVCGLAYYTSLVEMGKRGDGKRNVVFFHIPPLNGDAELEAGKRVTLALISALVEAIQ